MESNRIITLSNNVAALAHNPSITASTLATLPRVSELAGGLNLTRLCPDVRIASALIATSNFTQ